MDIELGASSFNAQELLSQAQVIAAAFAKGLEDNNCLLIVPLKFHQNINTSYNTLKDLAESVTAANNALSPTSASLNNIAGAGSTSTNPLLSPSVQNAIKSSKESCLSCNLQMPKLTINDSFSATMGKLQAQLDMYKNLFKLPKPNLCQGAYAFQSSCLPDIIKLIGFLLTAYLAILALQKMGNISISAFIQGVLSAILGTLLTSLNVSLNLSTSSIACLIDAIKQIADAIPTEENLENQLNANQLSVLGLTKPTTPNQTTLNNNYLNTISNDLKSGFGANISSQSLQSGNIFNPGAQSIINHIPNSDTDGIRKVFTMLTNTVTTATNDINEYVNDLMSFKTFFECEAARNGSDISSLLTYISNITNVLNMLSSIAMMIAKKEIKSLCQTNATASSNADSTGLGNDEIKDYLQEYYQQAAAISATPDNDVQIMIYQQPLQNALPKLNLFNCSLNDFIQAHTIENIMTQAQAQVDAESSGQPFVSPWESYSYVAPTDNSLGTIKSILDLLYDDPVTAPVGTVTSPDIVKSVFSNAGTTTDNTTNSLACKSIDDVMNVLKNLKGN